MSVENNRLLIIGSGELGKQVRHYAEVDGRWNCVGFIDDFRSVGDVVDGLYVLGGVKDLPVLKGQDVFDKLFIAFGYNCLKEKYLLYEQLKNQFSFATIIANPAYIDTTAIIEEGVFIYPGVIIDKEVIVRNNVLINLGTVLSHNVEVGESTFVGGNVSIAGFVKIGERSFIGIGTSIIDNINICSDCIFGGGSVVVKDIKLPGVYAGLPVRMIRHYGTDMKR